MQTMTKKMPTNWKGSDLRSRREVVQYLARHGGELEDKTGLVVGKMREDLKRGRALAQLLAEMEQDGMIEREVRGRRTFRIRLLNDWGLAEDAEPEDELEVVSGEATLTAEDLSGVDLTALAETLLAVVVKRMTAPVSVAEEDGAGPTKRELSDRLRRADRALQQAETKLREKSEEATALKEELAEARQQAKAFANNVEVLQREVRKLGARQPKTREVPVGELLGEEGKKALEQLMRALPETPASKPRKAAGGNR